MTLNRLAAWCGVLAGLCIGLPGAVEVVTGETAVTSFVLGVAPALALPLLTVLHLRQSDAAGSFGAVAYTVNVVGLGLFGGAAFTLNLALFYVDRPVLDELLDGPTRFALVGSAVVFAVGAVLFGVAMLRARIHPRVPSAGYLVALPVLALAAPLPDSVLTSGIHVAAGAAVAWLAATLWKS
ncbi:hypothetical protein [Actinophytocola algeriensis]|uniref:Uncharacterized protein n=1 Tax=Actinophytocola algeriensis TaxID=1768010 RepID=A0A7W7Q5K8_9PSEU|nr:hypothetical protein [Actinophytocola algeriensis]MBB4907472.1 hypothetical protein [Actinophytocola algeriensis]MBE1479502.1 hypothetical protein [Actinophytocola algeriensis]